MANFVVVVVSLLLDGVDVVVDIVEGVGQTSVGLKKRGQEVEY